MKGLAAVLVELGKPLVLEEIEIPKLTYGQVLVKVLCSGICGSQIGEINGIIGNFSISFNASSRVICPVRIRLEN